MNICHRPCSRDLSKISMYFSTTLDQTPNPLRGILWPLFHQQLILISQLRANYIPNRHIKIASLLYSPSSRIPIIPTQVDFVQWSFRKKSTCTSLARIHVSFVRPFWGFASPTGLYSCGSKGQWREGPMVFNLENMYVNSRFRNRWESHELMAHKSNQQINIEAQHFNNGLIFTSHPWPAMVRHQLPPNVPRSNLWIFLLDSKCNSKSHLKRGKPWKVRSDGVGVLWDLSWRVVKSIYIYIVFGS